ncbi:MAG: TonB-dependent receptor, partial [Phenylobacterium sp.]|nr:TonB-dependent receptor [Phenylobacterium sp.]
PGAPATRPERAERPGGGYGGGGGGYRGGGRGGGFGGFGGGGPRGGVFQFGVYHTVAFRDDILIRPGLPELDLLDGAAIGAGGGSPRHQVDVQANYTKGGLGASLNANWQAATRVEGGPTTDDLEFSDQTTVNLRLFADLGAQPIARDYRWLRGARATLSVDNLFDSRQEVRDGTGVTPISYQPDLLDPVGRSVKLTFRKLFF